MANVNDFGNSGKPVPPFRGYYYDEKSNRYFKIPPHESKGKYASNNGSETKEDEEEYYSGERRWQTNNITQRLCKSQIGNFEFNTLRRIATKRDIKKVNFIKTVSMKGKGIHQMMANGDGSRVIGVQHKPESRPMLLELHKKEGKLVPKKIHAFPVDSKNKICYTHLNSDNCSGVMFTNIDNGLILPGEVRKTYVGFLPRIFNKSKSCDDLLGVRLSRGSPFACAASEFPLSPYPLSYSDGRRVIVVSHPGKHFKHLSEDAEERNSGRSHSSGGPGISVYKLKSDVKCQCFSPVDPLHFNGMRNGQVHGTDLRMKLSTQQSCINIFTENGMSVKDMFCHRNGIYFFANLEGVKAALRQFDLRFIKGSCLRDYHGGMPLTKESGNICSLNWSFDGENMLCNYDRELLKVYDIQQWTILRHEMFKYGPDVQSLIYRRNWQMFKGESALLYSDKEALRTLSYNNLSMQQNFVRTI